MGFTVCIKIVASDVDARAFPTKLWRRDRFFSHAWLRNGIRAFFFI